MKMKPVHWILLASYGLLLAGAVYIPKWGATVRAQEQEPQPEWLVIDDSYPGCTFLTIERDWKADFEDDASVLSGVNRDSVTRVVFDASCARAVYPNAEIVVIGDE